MIKRYIMILMILIASGCGGGSNDNGAIDVAEGGTNAAMIGDSVPVLISATVYDDYFAHAPPKIWRIDDYMRFEAVYSDADGDAQFLELTLFAAGEIYSGPYVFALAPGEASFYTDSEQVVEGEPGVYDLEFQIVDSRGNESEVFASQIRLKAQG
jgi:hypothetical protein